MSSIDYFAELPLELSLTILSYFDFKELLEIELVNKSWQQLCLDSTLWAADIDSGSLRTFNYTKFNKFLKLALCDNSVQRVKQVTLGQMTKRISEQCLERLTHSRFPYPGKSIGVLNFESRYFTVRQARALKRLVPCQTLSVVARSQKASIDLDEVIKNQGDTLECVQIDAAELEWNDYVSASLRPVSEYLREVHLRWIMVDKKLVFALFAQCPNLQKAKLTVQNFDQQVLEMICTATARSDIETLEIDCRDKSSKTKVRTQQRSDLPGWNDPPEWPKWLTSLTLIGAKDDYLKKIGGSLQNLEHLNLARSSLTLGTFLQKFQIGPALRQLNLYKYKGQPFASRLLMPCPRIEWLNISHVKLGENALDEILSACPRLRAIDISFTNIPLMSIFTMRHSQVKFAGINGLVDVDEKAFLEMEYYGITCPRHELELDCLSLE